MNAVSTADNPADVVEIVLGLGSNNGDDRFGWSVVDELMRGKTTATLCKLAHPIDVLPWLGQATRVHLVDAVVGLSSDTAFMCLEFSNPDHRSRLRNLRCRGTHDLGVYASLMMAQTLGMPTHHVLLWMGPASEFQPLGEMSETTRASVRQTAAQLSALFDSPAF
tara:strand:+ start:168222 stop:168716 length:495 start_codon:yes stop_codon:yes gene_type:complete